MQIAWALQNVPGDWGCRYAALLAAREASGRFAEGEAQTLSPLRKGRDSQAAAPARADAACQVRMHTRTLLLWGLHEHK